MADASLRDLRRRVLAAHAAHALPIWDCATPSPPPPLPDELRLRLQRSAIAHVMKQANLARPQASVVEFGAGNGELSRALWAAGVAARSVLVDRSKSRMARAVAAGSSARSCCEADAAEPADPNVSAPASAPTAAAGAVAGGRFVPVQLCVDVLDLQAERLRAAAPGETVLLSNHMCGSALDVAVSCALAAYAGGELLLGVVAATCCHHLCDWNAYVGQAFFREVGLGAPFDFDNIRRWSRLAPRREKPSASRSKGLEAAQKLGILPDEAAELGLRCRQLLDTGRARHLEARGFSVALVRHVPFTLTADNLMILAVRPAVAGPNLLAQLQLDRASASMAQIAIAASH